MGGLSLLVAEFALDVVFQSSILFLVLISSFVCFRTFKDHLEIGRLPALQICCFRVVAIAPVYAGIQWGKLLLTPLFPVWKTAGRAHSLLQQQPMAPQQAALRCLCCFAC